VQIGSSGCFPMAKVFISSEVECDYTSMLLPSYELSFSGTPKMSLLASRDVKLNTCIIA